MTPLGFLTVSHKSHFKKISNQYSKVFFNMIFFPTVFSGLVLGAFLSLVATCVKS